jgi:putative oxidoreductase
MFQLADKARPVVLLLARIAVGVVFIAHGLQKFANGIDGTAAFFESVGIPAAGLAAPAVATVEVLGGAALILGALLPLFGILLALTMFGAFVFVHASNGLFLDQGGYEFVLVLAAASLTFATTGGGALALDGLRQRRSADRVTA